MGLIVLVLALAAPTSMMGAQATDVPPAPLAMRFVDATSDAGLGGFLHAGFLGNDSTKPQFPEEMGPGTCWLDADGDGRLDLLLVNGRYHTDAAKDDRLKPTTMLYHNDGGGHFSDATSASGLGVRAFGMGCSVADYDNDGHPDVFLSAYGGSYLFHNNGDGTFANVTHAMRLDTEDCSPYPCWDTGGAWIDADRDGCLDLYETRFGNYTLDTGQGNDPVDAPQQANTFWHGACGAAPFVDETSAVGLVTYGNTWSALSGDINGDGWPDLYEANDGDPNVLWLNDGHGNFAQSERGVANGDRSGMGSALGDLNGDGLPDLVTTNYANQGNGVFLQQDNGTFRDVGLTAPFNDATPYVGWGVDVLDLDNDGRNDLFVVNGMTEDLGAKVPMLPPREPTHVYLQQGDGSFQEANASLGDPLQQNYVGRAAAWADVNDDGSLGVVVTEAGENPTHYWRLENVPGTFLSVDLVGNASGVTRDALGARVTVQADGVPTLTREKSPQMGFMATNDPRLHFGLGNATEANLTVRWPDGSSATFAHVPAGSFVRLTQGEPLVIVDAAPVATLTAPALVRRGDAFTASATLTSPITQGTWDMGDGSTLTCDASACRDGAGNAVGTVQDKNVSVTHAYATAGKHDITVSLTTSNGRAALARASVRALSDMRAHLSWAKAVIGPQDTQHGVVRVLDDAGAPVAGASIRVDVTYSLYPQIEPLILPHLPFAVRDALGYRTLTLEGTTNATGAYALDVPLWQASPSPLAPQAAYDPIGEYTGNATGDLDGLAIASATASYQVR